MKSPREQLIGECDNLLFLLRCGQIDDKPENKSKWSSNLDAALDIRSRLMAGRPVPSISTSTNTANNPES